MHFFRRICAVIIGLVISTNSFAQYSSSSTSVQFRHNIFTEALQIAKAQDKHVFIDTYAKWCIPCKKMDKVFRDPEVASYFNAHFINVKVDMDQKSIADQVRLKYDVFFLPTLLMLDNDGNVLFRSDNQILTALEMVGIAKAINQSPEERAAQYAADQQRREQTRINSQPVVQNTQNSLKTVSPTVKPSKDAVVISEDKMLTKSPHTGATVLADRPKINDSDYSENPDEKVLFKLDTNGDIPDDMELPPELMYELSYFKLRQMDGSHYNMAKRYLDSQTDWSTEKNMRFIFDFLITTDSPQFDYLIQNKNAFNTKFGEAVVNQSIDILANQKLYRGVPRPDLTESITLFSYMNSAKPEEKAYQYFLNRLKNEERKDDYKELGIKYIDHINSDDALILTELVRLFSTSTEKKDYKKGLQYIDKLIEMEKAEYFHYHLRAVFHINLGNKMKAHKAIEQAIASAKANGIDYSKTKLLKNQFDL